jgi:hypothetical protein
MRPIALLLPLALLAFPVMAQEEGGKATTYENQRYQVTITVPAGWTKAWEGPKSAGNWVDLARFEEEQTGARVTLSTSASHYRSSEEMIKGLRNQYDKESRLAILRREELSATSKRPKGILFEYTMRGDEGPVHALTAYFLHLGRRYRVYASVREVGWKSASRAFGEKKQNFIDEGQNFSLYYPETWSVRLPARGARVVFEAPRLGAAVRIYVAKPRGSLRESVRWIVDSLKEKEAKMQGERGPETHPALGVKVMTVDYTMSTKEGAFSYHMTAVVHRDRFYRIVLVGTETVIPLAMESYERMISTLSFMK